MRINRCEDSISDFATKRSRFKSLVNTKYYQYLCKLADNKKLAKKIYLYFVFVFISFIAHRMTPVKGKVIKIKQSFIKSVRKKSAISNVLRKEDGSLTSNDAEKAALLNNVFSAKFSNHTVAVLPDAPNYQIEPLYQFDVSEGTILTYVYDLTALKSLNPNKACGADNISAKIILECAYELLYLRLTKIFNKSVRTGVFPARRKEANIIPIYKKGDKKDPSK